MIYCKLQRTSQTRREDFKTGNKIHNVAKAVLKGIHIYIQLLKQGSTERGMNLEDLASLIHPFPS